MRQVDWILAAVLCLMACLARSDDVKPVTAAEKLPIEDFAHLPFVESAAISPDGTRWCGVFGIDGTQRILIMSLFDKSEKLTGVSIPDQTEIRWLRWVNNDHVLVGVTALRDVDGAQWYVSRAFAMNRKTGKLTALLPKAGGQNAGDLIWAPSDDGNEILVTAQNSIYADRESFWPAVYRIDLSNGHEHVEVQSHAGVMDWAADATGRVRIGVGYEDITRTTRLLYRAPGADSFRTIDRSDGRKGQGVRVPFMFLPDKEHALVMHDDEHGMTGIYEEDLATLADVATIYVPPSGEVDDVEISADGKTLLGASSTALSGTMHWFEPSLAQLQHQLDVALPQYRVQIESMSRDRTHMLIRATAPDAPGLIYFYDVSEGGLHRIAFVNERFRGRRLAPVKPIAYKARDGLAIEGLLTLPPGRDAHQLPLIVMPHGGPWAQDTLDYDYWQQFLANRGYAVIQPNFRGSTGYGTAFLRAGEGQLGLAMQDDVSDAVNWAVHEGIADPKRVCIVGASYGGYAAMWGIAKDPDLYRCAISIAGVSSLKREVNDFANDLRAHTYADSWKRMTPDFDAVSPIKAVDKIKTPLLLIHGKKDVTVAFEQSSKMYDRMHKAGKDVDILLLPLADHHFQRQDDRVALLDAMEKFLNKYNAVD